MNTTSTFENASISKSIDTLDGIHQQEVNISIWERNLDSAIQQEIQALVQADINLRIQGSKAELCQTLVTKLNSLELPNKFILEDFKLLLNKFEAITQAKNFRVMLAVVETNMCKRFHFDMNYLRLLCTYDGQGTLWLPEEAVDRDAQSGGKKNEDIVQNQALIQQVATEDVLILKGKLYPEAKAIIHRSPSIEETEEKRLLLRFDIK